MRKRKLTKKDEDIKSSEIVSTPSGRQYHINLAPGELAEYILLCGDPARAERTAELFTHIELERRNREFVTYTGNYDNMRISVISTGIGTDNIEITLIESFQITKEPTFIRIGSCGGLQPEMAVGDLVISTGAVRLENTSTYFVPDGYPAVANYEVVLALISAAEKLGYRYHVGLTASASGFYGAQGRKIPGLPLRYPKLQDEMAEYNVANFEMESSTLFILCNLKGVRASTVCAVYASRPHGTFISTKTKSRAERACILTGLEAFKILAQMDKMRKKRKKRYWYPAIV
jgi:uridine phosphorylase